MNTPSPFPLVVDHAYLWVSKGAPEMALLRELGLQPHDRISRHETQGSASQSILFRNCYLELVWIEDQAEFEAFVASNPDVKDEPLTWKETGASPFGVGLHYRTPDTAQLPIETTLHTAPWMPEDSSIQVIPQVSPRIPSFFILHGSLAYSDCRPGQGEHPLGVKYLTSISITVTSLADSDPLSPQLTAHGVVTLKQGAAPLMELTFDDQAQGNVFDARPAMPLVIRY